MLNKFSHHNKYLFEIELQANSVICCNIRLYSEHIGHLVRMSVSGYRGRRFEPRHLYVVSLSKTLYPHCSS